MEEEEQGALSPSMLMPLRMLRHHGDNTTDDRSDNQRQLAVVNPTSTSITTTTRTSRRFRLPPGWRVQQVLRSKGDRVDRYYIESGTGCKLRSRKEVERYLTGEQVTRTRSRTFRLDYHVKPSQSMKSRKMIISGGKMFRLDEREPNHCQLAITARSRDVLTSRFNLPDGWVVEEVPRRYGCMIDKYYYEPGTGRKFRSLVAVEKYLSEVDENSPLSLVVAELKEINTPLSKVFNLSSRMKNGGSRKNSISKNKVPTSSLLTPPTKINWVIASSNGDSWNAFIGDTIVSEPVKQQWMKRFMLAINDSQHKTSEFG